MLGSELCVLLRTITLPIQTLTCGREDQLSNTQVRASLTPCLLNKNTQWKNAVSIRLSNYM